MYLILIFSTLMVEVHGRGFFGKYITEDSLYNIDSSIEAYCDLLKFGDVRFFIDFQTDLDMARQIGNISLDPRYAHWYITPGLTVDIKDLVFSGYVVHDCIHDIDIENPGTPVFNRFRLSVEPSAYHIRNWSKAIATKPLWRLMIGSYPQFEFYDWTNWGADYKYEMQINFLAPIISRSNVNFSIGFDSHIIKREGRGFYQKHIVMFKLPLLAKHGLFTPFFHYYIYNDDPLKSPSKMPIFGAEVFF